MSTYINNKLFTYVSSYKALLDNTDNFTTNIKENYPNSLVFVGDERIIWQPLTNTYIGIGQSAYSYIISQLDFLKESTGTTAATPHVDVLFSQNDDNYITTSKIDGVNNGIRLTTSDDKLAYFTALSTSMQLNLDGLDNKLKDDLSYLKKYVVSNTNKQINTLYQLLLGADEEPTNIYVEHELDHFFDPKTNETFNEAGLWIDIDGKNTWRPVKLIYDSTNNQYQIKDEGNDTLYETFTADSNGNIISVKGPSTHAHGTEVISDNGTPDNTADDVISYIIYSRPTGKTNSYVSGTSIVDSIDTIREIAYILDVITDGNNDNGVALAYSIVGTYTGLQDEISNRKTEDANIRNEMVKDVSISGNDYLNVVELNTYTYNGLRTGSINTYLSINVAEVDNNTHKVGYFDSSNNWHWVYEDPSNSLHTSKLEVGPNSLDDETLSYYYTEKTGDGKYIFYHKDKTNYTSDPNSYLYTKNADKTFTKHTIDDLDNINPPFIEIKPYEDKYKFDTNGYLSNGNKLLTTVDWVSSYVAVLNNEFRNLDVDSDISSYLTDNDKFQKKTYEIAKNLSAYNIITSLTPVITNEGIQIQATSIPIIKDVINIIDTDHNTDTSKLFNVTCDSNLHTSDDGYAYTVHDLHLTYTLLTDTLNNPNNISQTSLNSYDGFASAHDVSQTFTDMFSWYDLSTGTEVLYGS